MNRRHPTPVKLAKITCAEAVTPDSASSENDSPVWVQVATEGNYKGYAGGEISFTFDQALFDNLVTNFRKHPSFKKDEQGVGCSDVIAWDFHHASEMSATSGTIPTQGTPAQGWVRDVQTRKDAKSGKCTLWALTRWLEPARTYVKNEQYRWASVSVVFDAIDPISGTNVGAVLTSIALTNQPFIEGMTPLAADRHSASKVALNYFYPERAGCAEDALESIRRMLGLPETADAATVVGELAKVATWVASGTTPAGVEVGEIVENLRLILNLPALSSDAEVMVEVDKLFAALSSEQSTGPVSAPGTEQQPAPPAMETMNMLSKIAEKLGTQANESAVLDAVSQLVELRQVVATSTACEATASTKVILKAAVDDSAVRAKYGAILKALGVPDADAALNRLAGIIADSEALKATAPELAALKAQVAEIDSAEQVQDVNEAMDSAGIEKASASYAAVRDAIALSRKSLSRAEFQKLHPKRTASKTTLTSKTSGEPASAVTASRTGSSAGAENADAVDVTAYEGPTLINKTCSYVRASVAGADKWEWDRVHEHAATLVRTGKVKNG